MSRERDFVVWLEGYLYGRDKLEHDDISVIFRRINFAKDSKGVQYQNIVDKYKHVGSTK